MKTSTGMGQDTELLALHQSRLVSWVVQQFGKALLVGILALVVAAAALALMGADGGTVGLWSAAVSFFAFALYLASGTAPPPITTEDEDA